MPKAKREWGWLKGKFTNAARLNLKEYDAKSQSTEQDNLQLLQLCLWALAAICYSLYFIYPFFLCSPVGRVPVLLGYWDWYLAAFPAWALYAFHQHGAQDCSCVLHSLSRSQNCSEHRAANKNSENPSLVTTSPHISMFIGEGKKKRFKKKKK